MLELEDWGDSDDEVIVTTSRKSRPPPPAAVENELGDSSSEKEDSAAYSDSFKGVGSESSQEEERDELEEDDDEEDLGLEVKPRTTATRSPVKSSRLSRAAARPIKEKSAEYESFEESSSESEEERPHGKGRQRLRKRAVSVETGESSDDLLLRTVEKVRREPEREVLVLDSDESEGEDEDEDEDEIKRERIRFQNQHYRVRFPFSLVARNGTGTDETFVRRNVTSVIEDLLTRWSRSSTRLEILAKNIVASVARTTSPSTRTRRSKVSRNWELGSNAPSGQSLFSFFSRT